jgi:drug/metabolite transporter (DMT)-like permease
MSLSDRGKGVVLVAISAFAFGSTPIWGKIALSSGLNIETLLAFRLALASFLLWVAMLASGYRPMVAHRELARLFLLATLGFGITAFCFFTALLHIPASLTQMVFFSSYPTLATLLSAWILREPLGIRKMTALVVVVAGGILLVGSSGREWNKLWLLLPLGAGMAYSLYLVLGTKLLDRYPPRVVSLWVITFGALQFGLYGLFRGRLSLALAPSSWFLIGVMALLCTVVSVLSFFAGLERIGASRAAIVSTLEPVFTLFLAALFLGERLIYPQLLGAGAVVAGILLLQWEKAGYRAGRRWLAGAAVGQGQDRGRGKGCVAGR